MKSYDNLYNKTLTKTPNLDYYFSFVNVPHRITNSEPIDGEPTSREVTWGIGKAPLNKSCGPDGLYMEYFKHDGLVPHITKLFQVCYASLTFPSLWNKAIILPIYKSGDPVNPLNYRGVALQCTLLKAYTSILNLRLNTWLEENNILKKEQLGFRKEHGCLEHALSLYLIHCKKLIC